MPYARIPDPRLWPMRSWEDAWDEVALSICSECGQPIGFDRLARMGERGWVHSPCPGPLVLDQPLTEEQVKKAIEEARAAWGKGDVKWTR